MHRVCPPDAQRCSCCRPPGLMCKDLYREEATDRWHCAFPRSPRLLKRRKRSPRPDMNQPSEEDIRPHRIMLITALGTKSPQIVSTWATFQSTTSPQGDATLHPLGCTGLPMDSTTLVLAHSSVGAAAVSQETLNSLRSAIFLVDG
ncbi:hypothetical protein HPB50_014966 [Hyalomma asiaticum]|uniref:Uncharacterized protein n=1 Tax=Hyalomma asiaticum TaxID=266040 RepID=A0ACB7S2T2_HYAAI|nr:hypothetical protein HPB50_014966 [Hyalomma asiaticum]